MVSTAGHFGRRILNRSGEEDMSHSKRSRGLYLVVFIALLAMVAGCAAPAVPAAAPAADAAAPAADAAPVADAVSGGLEGQAAVVAPEFFDQAEYDRSMAEMTMTPTGPEGQPWIQLVGEHTMVDTSALQKDGPYTFCFSNAGVNNPWRVVGWTTMQAEVALHPEIEELIHVDAEGSDEKQIADIADLVASGNCDVLIVSPNTTAALTPAIEQACTALPVVVFDRGVFTDCPTTFIQPLGGYAFGHTGAQFIVDNCTADPCNVLALRILPGVDVLEQRWAAAKLLFSESPSINVLGVEFGDGDNAKVKGIVSDYLDRFGTIDAVWMDAGASAVAALEAFEDAGQPYPVMVGEDQQDYLVKWQENGITGVAPTFPTFQWRTPIIAALDIMNGQPVPDVWRLPQPTVTQENLDQYVQPNMPPLHYAMCGCEEMPGFPQEWGGE
jgi:ribose transport system substrate-binding protein